MVHPSLQRLMVVERIPDRIQHRSLCNMMTSIVRLFVLLRRQRRWRSTLDCTSAESSDHSSLSCPRARSRSCCSMARRFRSCVLAIVNGFPPGCGHTLAANFDVCDSEVHAIITGRVVLTRRWILISQPFAMFSALVLSSLAAMRQSCYVHIFQDVRPELSQAHAGILYRLMCLLQLAARRYV
mmetsp:Transcript_40942/g.131691  ORF Transcript_40942/g.131691 Transcript_40942/m.131691 type:complete len:183 (-) Transcript_40942:264-812(-)